MANKRHKKTQWRTLTDHVNKGPGKKKLLKIMLILFMRNFLGSKRELPTLEIGGYRSYMIKITGMTLNQGESMQLEGVMDYPANMPAGRALNGKSVRILRYDPHKRTAEKIEIFD